MNGRREAIGNEWPAVRSELTAAALEPSAVLHVTPVTAGDALHVTVSIADIPDAAHGRMRVVVALAENDLAVDVKRGENARRRLRHSAVTRRLEAAGNLNAAERSAQVNAELYDRIPRGAAISCACSHSCKMRPAIESGECRHPCRSPQP